MQKPKIIGIYKELSLIGQEIHIKLARSENDDSVSYVSGDGDGDPPCVTGSITYTEGICIGTEVSFKDKIKSLQVRFVVPRSTELADEVRIKLRRPK